jgi:hypothetical protein
VVCHTHMREGAFTALSKSLGFLVASFANRPTTNRSCVDGWLMMIRRGRVVEEYQPWRAMPNGGVVEWVFCGGVMGRGFMVKGATTQWSATIRLTGWSVPTTQIRRHVRLAPFGLGLCTRKAIGPRHDHNESQLLKRAVPAPSKPQLQV